jgi:hypothetical protein
MNVSKSISLILLAIGSICSSCKSSRELAPQTKWQAKKVSIDGQLNEWMLPLRYYSSGGQVGYTLSNDSANLYICIRTADQLTEAKMLRAGMDIGIDTAGKNDPTFHILYPLAKARSKASREDLKKSKPDPDATPDYSAIRRKTLQEQTIMQLIGFADANGEAPLKAPNGVQVSMNIDSLGIVNYEAVIPLKTFYKETLTTADTIKTFGFRILINGISMPSASNAGGGGGGGHHGGGGGGMGGMGGGIGGGGMGGGGMPGGGGGGHHRGGGGGGSYSGGNPEMAEKKKIEMQFRLRVKG